MKFMDAAGNWFEIADREVDAAAAGAIPDYDGKAGTDNTEAFQRALDTGRSVVIRAGQYLTGTIYQRHQGQAVSSFGNLTWNGNGGKDAFPLLIIGQTATGAVFFNNGKLDHRGDAWRSARKGPASKNRAMESCVLLMATQSRFVGGSIENGFDNGVAILSADLATGQQQVGHPLYAKVTSVSTKNCGCGIRTHDENIGPHQAGAGVNLLTGAFALIEGCTDEGSRTNFIADYGGGCSGQFASCIGNNAKASISGSVSFEGEVVRPGGFGIYSGSGNVKWIGVQISDCEGWGAWFDGFSSRNDVELAIKSSMRGGVLLMGSGNRLMIPRFQDCGRGSPGSYPAVRVRGLAERGGKFVDGTGLFVFRPYAEGEFHTVAVEVLDGPNGQKVQGTIDVERPSQVRNGQPKSVMVNAAEQ